MNLRNRVISQADFDDAHEGLQRSAKLWDWSIELSPDPSNPRLVTLETLGLRQPAPPTPPEQLGPLDDEGLPTWDDDQTVEAPAVTDVELEGVPDDIPRQTAPMLTFGAAGGTVEDIEVSEATVHETVAAEAIKVDAVPSLEEYIRAGYDPAEYDRFVAEWQKEQGGAVARYVAAINAKRADERFIGAALPPGDGLERPATELQGWEDDA